MEESQKSIIQIIIDKYPQFKRFLTNESVVDKIGYDRFCRFAKDTLNIIYMEKIGFMEDTGDGTHQLSKEVKESDYQKEFIDIMGIVYGPHAVKILQERPNLTFGNIPDIRVFEPVIYETFGEQFVNQLLNFDYREMTNKNNSYDAIIQAIIDNKEDLEAFKFCWTVISAQNGIDIYNEARLFSAYSKYSDLMKDCVKNIDNMTLEHYELLKDVLVQQNALPVSSIAELETYNERVADSYGDYKSITSQQILKKLIFQRFFGLEYRPINKFNEFTRDMRNVNSLIEVYGFQRVINYEEQLKAKGKEMHFTESELNAMRLCEAIAKYGSSGTIPEEKVVATLQKIYSGLCDGKIETIRPGDFNSILSKIGNVYSLELQSRLTSVQDLEHLTDSGDSRITRKVIDVQRDGKTYQIPVITLKGVEFAGLVSTVSMGLSGFEPNGTYGERWFEYEHGVSHISCSLATDTLHGALEYDEGYNNSSITYLMPKGMDIISMGPADIFSPAQARKANVYSNRNTSFQFIDEMEAKTYANYSFECNEYVIERYSLREQGHSNKIVPEALFKYGDQVTEEMLNVVIEMEEYVKSHGIRGEDFVMPIILVDRTGYSKEDIAKKIADKTHKKDLSEEQVKLGNNRIVSYIEGLASKYEKTTNSSELESIGKPITDNSQDMEDSSENI